MRDGPMSPVEAYELGLKRGRERAFDEAIRWFGGGGEGKSTAEAVHDERVVEELSRLRDRAAYPGDAE